MGRLIDIDEAYKVLTDYYHHRTEIQHKALKEAIERVPTVDAVKVVRCGECKYYRNGGCLTGRYDLKDTDFCSLGERKDETD